MQIYSSSGLTGITISKGVISIGEYAFYACTELTDITIPNGVTSIGSYASQYFTELTNITIPHSDGKLSVSDIVALRKLIIQG